MSNSVTVVFESRRPHTEPRGFRSKQLELLVRGREKQSPAAGAAVAHDLQPVPPAQKPPVMRFAYTCHSLDEFSAPVRHSLGTPGSRGGAQTARSTADLPLLRSLRNQDSRRTPRSPPTESRVNISQQRPRLDFETITADDVPAQHRKRLLRVAIEALFSEADAAAAAGSAATKVSVLYAELLGAFKSVVEQLTNPTDERGGTSLPLAPPDFVSARAFQEEEGTSDSSAERSTRRAHFTFASESDATDGKLERSREHHIESLRDENRFLSMQLADMRTAHANLQAELSKSYESYHKLQVQFLKEVATRRQTGSSTRQEQEQPKPATSIGTDMLAPDP